MAMPDFIIQRIDLGPDLKPGQSPAPAIHSCWSRILTQTNFNGVHPVISAYARILFPIKSIYKDLCYAVKILYHLKSKYLFNIYFIIHLFTRNRCCGSGRIPDPDSTFKKNRIRS